MIEINHDDLTAIKEGYPPQDQTLISIMTLANPWLEVIKDYYLKQVIAKGGSKVKILFGGEATGKSHWLLDIKQHAEQEGFFTIILDLSKTDFHLTDSVALYKAVAARLDITRLETVIIHKILKQLGYTEESYRPTGLPLPDYLCEREGCDRLEAKKTIRTCINDIVRNLELEFSFRKFMHHFMEAVVEKDKDYLEIGRRWIRGDKMERSLKTSSLLYETLSKHNARSWLYSFMEVVKFMDYNGVVIIIDQFESILPGFSSQVHYTPQKRNDVYELLRQLIDDMDFFKNILILIAGRTDIMEQEKYGLQSYHALWMRIQPGFQQDRYLNKYADLVDSDVIFYELKKNGQLADFAQRIEKIGLSKKIDHMYDNIPEIGFRNFRDLFSNLRND